MGAHASGLIGENLKGIPNNLMPYITKVAAGKLPFLNIFGNDYPTTDGTGMRDYIHVTDLAQGHIASFNHLQKSNQSITINLGTGSPLSVLELVKSFERVTGVKVPYRFTERRKGDLAKYYADPSLAKQKLGWEAQYGVDRMCGDTWRWHIQSGVRNQA